MPPEEPPVTPERQRRWEERFALPVLVAALASVPAVFLTLLSGPLATVGAVVNWASGAVLVAETVVLLALSGDRRAWLRRYRGMVGFAALVAVATVLALGPLQVLRLLRTIGAIRLIRARRIVRAAVVLRDRSGLTGSWSWLVAVLAGLLVAAFVAVVLADPFSRSRQLLERWLGWTGGGAVVTVIVAGLIVFLATWVVLRGRGDPADSGRD